MRGAGGPFSPGGRLTLTLTLFFLASLSPSCVSPAKILFLIPMSTQSEKHFFDPLITELASSRGHSLTVVTNSPSPTHSSHPNITEIVPITLEEVYGRVSDIAGLPNMFWHLLFLDITPYLASIHKIYSHPSFQPILREKYDLIFTKAFFGPAWYGLIHLNGGPFILLHSLPMSNALLKDWGIYGPPSHLPYPILEFTDRMTFPERVVNFLVDWAVYFHVEWNHMPRFEEAYRTHLGQGLPSVKEIQRNGSLLMMNTHFLSTFQRPTMPDVIEIGGLHCREAKPLPKELEDFVNKEVAPHGFIFISFGSVLKGSSLPSEIRQKFLRVFGRLKQRVIWKWEEEVMMDGEQVLPLPDNVLLKSWLPQQDILGHSNIRLFISHGGLLSIQQTIFHGVAVLTVPIFFDQLTNAKENERQGAGLVLNVWNFTEMELEETLNRMLYEPKFRTRAQYLSDIFRDQMNSPLERAVYWTEHVLKYDGAPHLRSSARELSPMQFHSLDVMGFLCFCLFLGITLVIMGIHLVVKCLTGGGGKKVSKEKRS